MWFQKCKTYGLVHITSLFTDDEILAYMYIGMFRVEKNRPKEKYCQIKFKKFFCLIL